MSQWKTASYISSPVKRRLGNKRRKSNFRPNVFRFIKINKNLLLVIIILALIITIVRLVYGYTIGKESNMARNIVFSDESVSTYDNKDMYKFIRQELDGKNITILKLKNGGTAKDDIIHAYPFIDDVKFEKAADSTLLVSLEYAPADMIFKNQHTSVAYANKFLFTVKDSDSISSGALFIEIPDYFSGELAGENVTGYISLFGTEKLKNDFIAIESALKDPQILFLAGAQKSIVSSQNLRVTFDHKRSILAQLEYLKAIAGLDQTLFYEIDLTTYPSVIIRKRIGGLPKI